MDASRTVEAPEVTADCLSFQSLKRDAYLKISSTSFELNDLAQWAELFTASVAGGWCAAILSTRTQLVIIPSDSIYQQFEQSAERERNELLSGSYTAVDIEHGAKGEHISATADGRKVVVCCNEGRILVYNAQTGQLESTHKTTSDVISLALNPERSELMACLLANGSVCILDTSSSSTVILGSDVTAICWSVKGKQLACGTVNGQVLQYNVTGELKASTNAPDDCGLAVLYLMWLENTVFLGVWAPLESMVNRASEDIDHSYEVYAINKDDKEQTVYVRIEDPTPAYGMVDRRSKRFTAKFKQWPPYKHLVVMASVPCGEIGILGCKVHESKESAGWQIQILDDLQVPRLPLDAIEGSSDTAPLGMGVIYNNKDPEGVDPILLVYTSDGVLAGWRITNTHGKYSNMSDASTTSTEGAPVQSAQRPFALQNLGSVAHPVANAFAAPSAFGKPAQLGTTTNPQAFQGMVATSPQQPLLGKGMFGAPSSFGQTSRLSSATAPLLTLGSSAGFGKFAAGATTFGAISGPSHLTKTEADQPAFAPSSVLGSAEDQHIKTTPGGQAFGASGPSIFGPASSSVPLSLQTANLTFREAGETSRIVTPPEPKASSQSVGKAPTRASESRHGIGQQIEVTGQRIPSSLRKSDVSGLTTDTGGLSDSLLDLGMKDERVEAKASTRPLVQESTTRDNMTVRSPSQTATGPTSSLSYQPQSSAAPSSLHTPNQTRLFPHEGDAQRASPPSQNSSQDASASYLLVAACEAVSSISRQVRHFRDQTQRFRGILTEEAASDNAVGENLSAKQWRLCDLARARKLFDRQLAQMANLLSDTRSIRQELRDKRKQASRLQKLQRSMISKLAALTQLFADTALFERDLSSDQASKRDSIRMLHSSIEDQLDQLQSIFDAFRDGRQDHYITKGAELQKAVLDQAARFEVKLEEMLHELNDIAGSTHVAFRDATTESRGLPSKSRGRYGFEYDQNGLPQEVSHQQKDKPRTTSVKRDPRSARLAAFNLNKERAFFPIRDQLLMSKSVPVIKTIQYYPKTSGWTPVRFPREPRRKTSAESTNTQEEEHQERSNDRSQDLTDDDGERDTSGAFQSDEMRRSIPPVQTLAESSTSAYTSHALFSEDECTPLRTHGISNARSAEPRGHTKESSGIKMTEDKPYGVLPSTLISRQEPYTEHFLKKATPFAAPPPNNLSNDTKQATSEPAANETMSMDDIGSALKANSSKIQQSETNADGTAGQTAASDYSFLSKPSVFDQKSINAPSSRFLGTSKSSMPGQSGAPSSGNANPFAITPDLSQKGDGAPAFGRPSVFGALVNAKKHEIPSKTASGTFGSNTASIFGKQSKGSLFGQFGQTAGSGKTDGSARSPFAALATSETLSVLDDLASSTKSDLPEPASERMIASSRLVPEESFVTPAPEDPGPAEVSLKAQRSAKEDVTETISPPSAAVSTAEDEPTSVDAEPLSSDVVSLDYDYTSSSSSGSVHEDDNNLLSTSMEPQTARLGDNTGSKGITREEPVAETASSSVLPLAASSSPSTSPVSSEWSIVSSTLDRTLTAPTLPSDRCITGRSPPATMPGLAESVDHAKDLSDHNSVNLSDHDSVIPKSLEHASSTDAQSEVTLQPSVGRFPLTLADEDEGVCQTDSQAAGLGLLWLAEQKARAILEAPQTTVALNAPQTPVASNVPQRYKDGSGQSKTRDILESAQPPPGADEQASRNEEILPNDSAARKLEPQSSSQLIGDVTAVGIVSGSKSLGDVDKENDLVGHDEGVYHLI